MPKGALWKGAGQETCHPVCPPRLCGRGCLQGLLQLPLFLQASSVWGGGRVGLLLVTAWCSWGLGPGLGGISFKRGWLNGIQVLGLWVPSCEPTDLAPSTLSGAPCPFGAGEEWVSLPPPPSRSSTGLQRHWAPKAGICRACSSLPLFLLGSSMLGGLGSSWLQSGSLGGLDLGWWGSLPSCSPQAQCGRALGECCSLRGVLLF